MSALEDRLRRFAYEWNEAMNSSYTVNMMPMLREAASDIRSIAAPSLEAENAKLRELVRDVHTLHWNGLDCTECPWFDECDTTGGCPWLGIFADHMRELGMEVE